MVLVQGKKDYTGYQVISASADTKEKEDLLTTLKESEAESRSSSSGNLRVRLLVNPNRIGSVISLLKRNNIEYSIVVSNLQQEIDEEMHDTFDDKPLMMQQIQSKGIDCGLSSGMSWTRYHSYKTIVAYMDCLASKYSDITEIYTIGKSYEGRYLKVMKIGGKEAG